MTTTPRPLTPDGSQIEAHVVSLRSSGRTYEQIAMEIGLSGKSQAFRILQRALRRIPAERVDELRALDSARLDAMTSAIWPKALSGDPKAIGLMLKILERRARMLGLDRESTSPTTPDPLVLDEMAEALVERMALMEDLVENGTIVLPEHMLLGESRDD